MNLLNSIVISGIFGKKDNDLDILPPPPPFPHIREKEKEMIEKERSGKEEQKKEKEQERLRLKEEKQQQKELERKKLEKIKEEESKKEQKERERKDIQEQKEKAQEEGRRQKELEEKSKEEKKRRRELEKKKRLEEIKRKNQKLMERRAETAKKKTFHFLNRVGMAKTMKEKAEHHRQRKEYTELRKNADKILAEAKHRELEKEKQVKVKEKEPKKKKDSEIEEKAVTGFEEKPAFKKEKKSIFGKIFMRKDEELEKELEELDKKSIEPLEIIKEPKIEEPGEIEEEIEKPHDAAIAEEEIQKAIEGIKKKEKKPSIFGRLFKKKEVKEQAMETPEVMPSFEEKADEAELIEEKIHKARLALMDFKFDTARKIYIEIMRMYNDMDSRKKARVYRDIKDLYYERKAAEKYAK